MYEPVFKGHLEGYTVNFLTREYWRVKHTMTMEDAMQEAHCVFLKCKAKYQVEDGAHFTALYKTAWTRHFSDLSVADSDQRTHERQLEHKTPREKYEALESMGETDNDGYLAVLLRQAPAEVKTVLNLFLSAPQEVLDIALAGFWTKDNHMKVTGDRRLSRVLGVSEDALEATQKYFSV